jgi:hypothetical protein
MATPRELLDIELLVRDPVEHFSSPMDVVDDSHLGWDEKRRILESWICDAGQLLQAEAENMPGTDRPRLREAHLAMLELQKRR